MTVLSAQSIRAAGVLTPCREAYAAHGASGGLGPCGYDLALDWGGAKRVRQLRPGGFLLAAAAERFDMPPDLMAVVHDKSTWARRGLAVQNTVVEPGWRGFLTLELVNHGPEPLLLEAGVPIAQVVFHRLDAPTERPYAGKYQDQEPGPVPARER